VLPLIADSDGNSKLRFYYSKDSKAYRLKKVYESKDFSFRQEILQQVLVEAVKPTVDQPGVCTVS
jgi:hypothetical protein